MNVSSFLTKLALKTGLPFRMSSIFGLKSWYCESRTQTKNSSWSSSDVSGDIRKRLPCCFQINRRALTMALVNFIMSENFVSGCISWGDTIVAVHWVLSASIDDSVGTSVWLREDGDLFSGSFSRWGPSHHSSDWITDCNLKLHQQDFLWLKRDATGNL